MKLQSPPNLETTRTLVEDETASVLKLPLCDDKPTFYRSGCGKIWVRAGLGDDEPKIFLPFFLVSRSGLGWLDLGAAGLGVAVGVTLLPFFRNQISVKATQKVCEVDDGRRRCVKERYLGLWFVGFVAGLGDFVVEKEISIK